MKLQSGSAAETARQLDAWGFNVLPAVYKDKAPTVKWETWASNRASKMIPSWFGRGKVNYWIATGAISNCYVLDIDNDEADRWWREVVGAADLMDSTVRVKTAKGTHYYFWIDSSDPSRGWAFHDQGIDFDVRGTGGGVIAPPSVHPSGAVYEWIQAPDPDKPNLGMQIVPDWMKSRDQLAKYLGSRGDATLPTDAKQVDLTGPVSMLSALLAKPPKEGGRNDWLAKVSGHYAKTYRQQQDLYWAHVRQAAALLKPPLDPDEVTKVGVSIWNGEQQRHPDREVGDDCGYLLSTGDSLLTSVKVDKDTMGMAEWADFDLRVISVMEKGGDQGNLVYEAELHKKRGGEVVPVVLPARLVGAPNTLATWLSGYGVSISRPDKCYPPFMADNVRLLRYLESQNAPRASIVKEMGYDPDSGEFLTPTEAIRPDGPHPFGKRRPDPTGLVPDEYGNRQINFNYGFAESEDKAREVLNEVLTFHDRTTACVFGSWWAACFLKPQLMGQTSLFPIMVVEAASGSGKTNGMFGLLLQLAGSMEGPRNSSMAAMRNRLSLHNNGPVWIDDLDTTEKLQELLRGTTSGESMVKMNATFTGTVTYRLASPVVLSGEQVNWGDQKAMMDRIVRISPPKPDGRMSLKPGREDHPQWDDIVDLANRYPLDESHQGLTVFAGHYVRRCLELEAATLARMTRLRREVKKTVSGRQADKVALLLTGSWLLDRLCDAELDDATPGPWETEMRTWCFTRESLLSAGEWDNRLTTTILPWALRSFAWPARPKNAMPVFVTEDDSLVPEVWVSVPRLAEAWSEHQRGRIMDRTDTEKALQEQVKRCQQTPKHARFDAGVGDRRAQVTYWCLSGEVAKVVLDRSRGEVDA